MLYSKENEWNVSIEEGFFFFTNPEDFLVKTGEGIVSVSVLAGEVSSAKIGFKTCEIFRRTSWITSLAYSWTYTTTNRHCIISIFELKICCW